MKCCRYRLQKIVKVLQWLALVLIADNEEEEKEQQEDIEEGVETMIEKLQYFLKCIKI